MPLYPKYLKSIKGVNFAITGICWIVRNELISLIQKRGGKVSDKRAQVTNSTQVLVRGASSSWAFDKYGHKEAKIARMLKEGKMIVVVHDYDFQNLIERGNPSKTIDKIAGQPIEWFLPPIAKKEYIKICKISGSLDREHSVKGRLEQKFLRELLFGNKQYFKCSLCGKNFPVEIMIAAHIKARSECTLKEKSDFSNIVFPVCLLGCDSLYERGFLSINDSGIVEITQKMNITLSLKSFLNKLNGRKCLFWNQNNSKYFAWHYNRRFEP